MEIPIHIADYEMKLQQANKMIEFAQTQIPVRQLVMLSAAANLIMAQDNKGAHIQAHFQASMNSKENQDTMKPMIDKMKELQSMQDQMSDAIIKLNGELDKTFAESGIRDAELAHKKAMYQVEEDHAKKMSDLKTGSAVEKGMFMDEQRDKKAEAGLEQTALKQAAAEEKAKLDLQHQQQANELKIQQAAIPSTSDSGSD
jgi:hypothetical protein